MEVDWAEINNVTSTPPNPRSLPTQITCLAFDNLQELIWSGNGYGRVASHYSTQLLPYTSFRAHEQIEGPVLQILPCDKGILSISGKSVHLAIRRGLPQWHLRDDAFKDLKCMAFTSRGMKEVLVAGTQNQMFRINVENGTITQTIPTTFHYQMMRRAGQCICAATATGVVHLLDPDTASVTKSWDAYIPITQDIDARTELLVTCGGNYTGYGNTYNALMAMVFDLRTRARLPPIQLVVGGTYIRLHPKMSSTAIVVASSGHVQIVDLMNASSPPNLRNMNLNPQYETITLFEISSSGEVMAFADTNHRIRLWGSPNKAHFNENSVMTEFAEEHQPNHPIMDWSHDTPLSTIGIPHYHETLLSAWPLHLVFETGTRGIDPSSLKNLQKGELGIYGPNPFSKTRHRNQIEQWRSSDKPPELKPPKFLSEKERSASSTVGSRRKSDTFEALADKALEDVTKKEVPNMYANVEIKYSKFGVDDFDFAFYNNTVYSGLETHIANCYANPLLQLFRFIPNIRNLALEHTATSCLQDACLLCQLGFLIDMLEKANGLNCQAGNFLKTLSSLRDAANLHILEGSPAFISQRNESTHKLTETIQKLANFLLGKFLHEYRLQASYKSGPIGPTKLENTVITTSQESKRCAQCKTETKKPITAHTHSLIYPAKGTGRPQVRASRVPTFSQVLKTSMENPSPSRGWCDRCKRYQSMDLRKTVQALPTVLILNADIKGSDSKSSEARQLWTTPKWLPQEFGVVLNQQGQFFCFEGDDLKIHLERSKHPLLVYELVGLVADVTSGDNQQPHLVSMINVSPSSRESSNDNSWHIFNDFVVRSVSTEEALRFDSTWKMPSILAYQLKSTRHQIDDSWKQNLDTSLLFRQLPSLQTALALPTINAKVPEAGSLVAIDAEFVQLGHEEIHVNAGGASEVTRPARQGLARVSVLRDEGHDAVSPFIDDYIIMSEPIVNYLTAWSGIKPGDLDPLTSKHTLVSLKVAYKKLWTLLNLGCIFVGHGLLKDFRIINIHVPKAQVVDTVEKFFLKEHRRKLGLKFLSWHILKEEIQKEPDGHDSIEDANTALKLYRKWKEYEDAGITQTILAETYKVGAEVNFKVPGSADRPGTSAGETLGTGFGTPEPARSRAHTPSMSGGFGRGRELFGSAGGRSG